jgi:hypothetical protein
MREWERQQRNFHEGLHTLSRVLVEAARSVCVEGIG